MTDMIAGKVQIAMPADLAVPGNSYHNTVDQVVEGTLDGYKIQAPLPTPPTMGLNPRKSTSDPAYGVGLFMLKQTCLAICAPFYWS